MTDSTDDKFLFAPVNPVGYYDITPTLPVASGKTLLYMKRKPNWYHRQMVRILLGWKWSDIDAF